MGRRHVGAEHHLAADADHVAVDRRGAGGGVPGDRLGDVDRQPALGHRVEPLADLAGGERHRRGHLRDDEAGRHGVDGDAVLELVGQRVDQPDDAGLGRGVVGLADVAGDAGDRGDTDDGAVLVDHLLVQQLAGDPLGSGEVDRDHRVPPVLGHVGQLLVAGDAGVVHDHVDTAVLLLEVVGDPLRRVLGGDVEGEPVAAELLHQGLQVVGELGYVDTDDGRAVAVQHPGDLLTDAAAGAGDQGDPAGQGQRPVGDLAGGGGAVRADPDHLARDVGGLGGEQEGQRGGDRTLGAVSDVDELDGAALADLLAEAAGEPLECALGDPLGALDLLGRRTDDDDARAGVQAAELGGEEVAERLELGGVLEAGRVEDQALVLLAVDRRARCCRCRARPGSRAATRRAGRCRPRPPCRRRGGARDVPLQLGGVGQAEVLDQQLADG